MSERKRLLIVGCGDLGSRAGQLASRAGWRVFGMRRSGRALPEGIEPLTGDVSRPGAFALPKALGAVLYAVAADGRTEEAYRAAYVDGLANVLAALAAAEELATRIVFVSSTAVYGEANGDWVDEDSPPEPAGFTGRILLEGEALLRDAPVTSSSLRLAGIYGPGRTRLIDGVRSGALTSDPEAVRWTNRIHVDDAAGALLHVLNADAMPSVLNVVDREPVPRHDVLHFIAKELGVKPPEVPAPGAAGKEASRPLPNKRVRSDRLVQSGFRLAYPSYREGYAALIRR